MKFISLMQRLENGDAGNCIPVNLDQVLFIEPQFNEDGDEDGSLVSLTDKRFLLVTDSISEIAAAIDHVATGNYSLAGYV